MPYPVTRALFGAAQVPPACAPEPMSLRRAVVAYVEESKRRTNYADLAALTASGRPLALWGAGSYAQRLLAGSPLASARFIAVMDRDRSKQGTVFAGCPVTAPETALRQLPPDAVVVIASALAAEAIVAQCRSMGIESHVPGNAT